MVVNLRGSGKVTAEGKVDDDVVCSKVLLDVAQLVVEDSTWGREGAGVDGLTRVRNGSRGRTCTCFCELWFNNS
jgi:hypothetical protein